MAHTCQSFTNTRWPQSAGAIEALPRMLSAQLPPGLRSSPDLVPADLLIALTALMWQGGLEERAEIAAWGLDRREPDTACMATPTACMATPTACMRGSARGARGAGTQFAS